MNFESLANELLLDLFEYLSSIDLLRAFYDMNTRVTNLLFLHFQTNPLNLQSISKYDFDNLCQHSLPSLIDHIRSLRLSDDDDTPQQIDLFFAHHFSLPQFSSLQSLSIYRIYSLHSLREILDQLPSLVHLRHLQISRYQIVFHEFYDIGIIHRLGSLANLLSCHLDLTNSNDRYIRIPAMISFSLIDLSIPQLSLNIQQLFYFIEHLSNLRSLDIRIVDHSMVSSISSRRFYSIRKLTILFYGSYHSLNHLLQTMSNLQELKINMPSTYIDGYQWKVLLETHLSHLIVFQLKMSISIPHQKTSEDRIDEILHSFGSHFWIAQHQWFVQCHWVNTDASSIVYIYTLPYAFHNFLYNGNGQLKSTCSNADQSWSFNRIHNLHYSYIPDPNTHFSYVHFDNIHHLDLTIPFDDSFWSTITRFDRLKSLNIVLNGDICSKDIQLQLQALVNRSKHLRSLTYFSWSNQNIFPFEIENSSIRQLDLRSPNLVYNYLHCIELTRSSIGQQNQVLLINVEQRTNILFLIDHMRNLRALIVECPKRLQTSKREKENLIDWLEQHLPSTCKISNTNKTEDNIRLWIR